MISHPFKENALSHTLSITMQYASGTEMPNLPESTEWKGLVDMQECAI